VYYLCLAPRKYMAPGKAYFGLQSFTASSSYHKTPIFSGYYCPFPVSVRLWQLRELEPKCDSIGITFHYYGLHKSVNYLHSYSDWKQ